MLNKVDTYRGSGSGYSPKTSNYKVAESGERKLIGKSSAHGWEFKSNPAHIKAHINSLTHGKKVEPPHKLTAN
jgi:hypothetical protein